MKATEEIQLEWKQLQDYSKIDSLGTYSGVYIWGFYLDDFVPYMVGKAKAGSYSDIKNRLWSHLSSIMGGDYTIHKKENLRRFYDYKDKEKWNELAYIPRDERNFTSFVKDRYGWLKEHIDEMVDNFCFTYAVPDDKDTIEDLEKSVIQIIGIDWLWNVRGGDPKRFTAKGEDLEKRIKLPQ